MRAATTIIAALLLAPMWISTPAAAQGYDDLDVPASSTTKKKKEKKRAEVREITKGTYAKSNIGGALYLGSFSGVVNAGTSLGLAVGQDFIDQEKSSMAWEIAFFQGIHNGAHYEEQAQTGCFERGTCIQGDLRTYTFAGLIEYSLYPNRRIGIGIRAGGGVLLSPLLMDEGYYLDEVVQDSWQGVRPTYHDGPHPVGMGGPTFEYYTKLSHFSVGLDADVFYAVGFDLGASITGALKYTF